MLTHKRAIETIFSYFFLRPKLIFFAKRTHCPFMPSKLCHWFLPKSLPHSGCSIDLLMTPCEKKSFLMPSLNPSFIIFFEWPLVHPELFTRKNLFHGIANNLLDILNNLTKSERFHFFSFGTGFKFNIDVGCFLI